MDEATVALLIATCPVWKMLINCPQFAAILISFKDAALQSRIVIEASPKLTKMCQDYAKKYHAWQMEAERDLADLTLEIYKESDKKVA